MKKILLILCSFLITASLFAEEIVKDGLRYDVDTKSNTATVLGPDGKFPEQLVIPGKIGSVKVTKIGKRAFVGCSISSVTFPEGLQTIGYEAFSSCFNLSSVTFPEGLQTIGYGAFGGCSNLSSVTFPEGLKWIGENAFAQCFNLSSVTFPEGLQTIGYGAFEYCSNLSSVTFPEGLKWIGENAFAQCSNLSSVTFPEGLQTIGSSAFENCNLRIVTTYETKNIKILNSLIGRTICSLSVPESCLSAYKTAYPNVPYITSEKIKLTVNDGISYLLVGDKAILIKGEDIAEVNVPKYVEYEGEKFAVVEIGKRAFYQCYNLSSVTFPEGLQEIGNYAFSSCSNLSSVTFPEGLQTIGDEAFSGCENLSSVTFSDGLQSIGDRTFENCFKLSSVTSYSAGLLQIIKVGNSSRTLYVPPYLKEEYDKSPNKYRWKSIEIVYPTISFKSYGEKSYATFNGFISYKKDPNLTAYTATLDGSVLVLHEIKGEVIPAFTPVILVNELGTDKITLEPATSEMKPIKANDLSGVFAGQKMEGAKHYFLGFTNDELGMYHRTAVDEEGKFWLRHNSAYLDASKWNGGEGIKIVISDTSTSIDDTMVEALQQTIFNMQGQRVQEVEKGKMYIINGRKVIK